MAPICRYFPFIAALILAQGTTPVSGQVQQAVVFPAGQLLLADTPVRCGSVQTLVTSIDDIAKAMPGWIILDPRIVAMPGPIQHFWYAHECGHHMEGPDEARADCWAIRSGRDQGWFRIGDFGQLEHYMRDLPGDMTHLPGPQRVLAMRACFDTPAS